jgi:hypothetical protein
LYFVENGAKLKENGVQFWIKLLKVSQLWDNIEEIVLNFRNSAKKRVFFRKRTEGKKKKSNRQKRNKKKSNRQNEFSYFMVPLSETKMLDELKWKRGKPCDVRYKTPSRISREKRRIFSSETPYFEISEYFLLKLSVGFFTPYTKSFRDPLS